MRVFMVHVGNALDRESDVQGDQYRLRTGLLDGQLYRFHTQDIVNADSQMQSLVRGGVEIEYGHFFARRSVIGLMRAARVIRTQSKRCDIDAVHVMWGTSTALVAVLSSTKPVVISFCGSDLLGEKAIDGTTTSTGLLNKALSKLASVFAAANIVKSEEMRAELWRVASAKATVIPNGVDINLFRPMDRTVARTKLGIKHDGPLILYFYAEGQVVKNPRLAHEVVGLVKRTLPDANVLVITGVKHGELVFYYNACDALLLTSFHEGSNNSVKEAKACNLPVVSANVGDVAHQLEGVEPSCVVDNWNADLMAKGMVAILSKCQRSNGADSSPGLTLEHTAARVIDVYTRVVSKSKREARAQEVSVVE